MSFDPYVYPGTTVLKNKFHTKDKNFLQKIERPFTIKRSEEFDKEPLPEKFDYSYLKSIHKYIFQDIYEWAGEQRTVDLAKDGHIFCRVAEVEAVAESIFDRLNRENNFKGSTKKELAGKLSDLFFEINELHPFREGNGRTQRQFLSNLAKTNGFELDFRNISSEEMTRISADKDKKRMEEKINENLEISHYKERKSFKKREKSKDYER